MPSMCAYISAASYCGIPYHSWLAIAQFWMPHISWLWWICWPILFQLEAVGLNICRRKAVVSVSVHCGFSLFSLSNIILVQIKLSVSFMAECRYACNAWGQAKAKLNARTCVLWKVHDFMDTDTLTLQNRSLGKNAQKSRTVHSAAWAQIWLRLRTQYIFCNISNSIAECSIMLCVKIIHLDNNIIYLCLLRTFCRGSAAQTRSRYKKHHILGFWP